MPDSAPNPVSRSSGRRELRSCRALPIQHTLTCGTLLSATSGIPAQPRATASPCILLARLQCHRL